MLEQRCSATSADIIVMDLASPLISWTLLFPLSPSLKGQSEQPPASVYHKKLVDESKQTNVLSVHILWKNML